MTTKTILRYEPEEELELWCEALDAGHHSLPQGLLQALCGDDWWKGSPPNHQVREKYLAKLGLPKSAKVTLTNVHVRIDGAPIRPSELIKRAAQARGAKDVLQFMIVDMRGFKRLPVKADYVFRSGDGRRTVVSDSPIGFDGLGVTPKAKVMGCRVWSQDVRLTKEFARNVESRKGATWTEIQRTELGTPLTALWTGRATAYERAVESHLKTQLRVEQDILLKRAVEEATASFKASI